LNEEQVTSGIPELDEIVQGLRLGDNVVFQVQRLSDYQFFALPFLERALSESRKCVYLRFAPQPPVSMPREGLRIVEINPGQGFDAFSREVHELVEESGKRTYYVLDNLSRLALEWATDELLANFFQVTCPLMFELDCVAYFALSRGKHDHSAIARIRDTTQLLLDVFRIDEHMYVHPLKVWDRYSPYMFLPHSVADGTWQPVFDSGTAAAVSAEANVQPFEPPASGLAPWDSVYDKLKARMTTTSPGDPEVEALKSEFARMLTGQHQDFSGIIDEYLTLEDLLGVRHRMLGSGQIGGKATGMLLARAILGNRGSWEGVVFDDILDSHDSFYIGADVFFSFLVQNDLFRLRLKMTSDSAISDEEFAEVERRFLEGRFSHSVEEQFRDLLDYYGQAPIIVRSSSLLEDSFGNAFAGKYRSEFCANQGSPDERLEVFKRAVKLVYASALNPDALAYRRKRGLGVNDEQMAILVQRVSGTPYRGYFFPPLAGVAFSKNLYAWGDRIDPREGVVRIVMGLGTRAVDRVASDYPRMLALSHPELRPEGSGEISKYSQHYVDLLDLRANSFSTVPLDELLVDGDYPDLSLIASLEQDGSVIDFIGRCLPAGHRKLVLTFDRLVKKTKFVEVLRAMLACLEDGYGCPVDIEFTAFAGRKDRVRVNLLQCRPLFVAGESGVAMVPDSLEPWRVLFRTGRMIGAGRLGGIRYILYIDPRRYSAMTDPDLRRGLGRLIGRLNDHPRVKEDRIVLMGPGRWGSTNLELGIDVRYGEIDNACALIELAREESGHVPEVSYGTHFFQDLVEEGIIYMPVWPDDPGSEFNERFFEAEPNALLELVPGAEDVLDVVKVIDLGAENRGRTGVVVADPRSRKALMYLEG
jgi:hypothetical protein